MRKHRINTLSVSYFYSPPEDLGVLEHFSFVRHAHFCLYRISDLTPFRYLRNLRSLLCRVYTKRSVDFSWFPHLQSLDMEFWPGAQTVFESKSIRFLRLTHYSAHDCGQIGRMRQLRALDLVVSPVRTVEHLGSLKFLQILELRGVTKLASLKGLRNCQRLRLLCLDGAGKIDELSEVARLPRLNYLYLVNMKDVESLAPLRAMKHLRHITIHGNTSIVDGDMSALIRRPRLWDVDFRYRKHYSHRPDEIPIQSRVWYWDVSKPWYKLPF